MIRIPFSFLPVKVLSKIAPFFLGLAELIEPFFPNLKVNLKQARMDIDSRDYISLCLPAFFFFFLFSTLFLGLILNSKGIAYSYFKSMVIVLIFSFFIFLQQIFYPKLVANKRVKGLERNLMPAMENFLVQLNSGIPLFEIMVNISKGDYGNISKEFSITVKEINAGKPQIEALDDMIAANPSLLFRKTIWYIVNGMKSGADLVSTIKEAINSLAEEQVIQIQNYGGQLSPLAMFYMLVAVIIPTLGMTFLIIISSFISLGESTTKLVFFGLYGFVFFFQLMFIGIIKNRRPNLLIE